MRRRHDLLQVAGDPPHAFRWRDRRYVVTEVLGSWVEAPAWWRPARDAVASPPRQHQWWRVAARLTHPAARGSTGVYELCRSGETWLLRRVHD